jgi:cytochrome c
MFNCSKARVFAGLLCGALIFAGALAASKANPKKGKVFYKKNCRVCHDGSTEASDLSPISKTMAQWEKAFKAGGVVESHLGLVKEKVGTELTEQDLLDIQAYLIYHAADSDHPATCGKQ